MDKKYLGVPFYSEPSESTIKLDHVPKLVDERLKILRVLVSNKDDYTTIKGNPNYYAALKSHLIDSGGSEGDNFFKILSKNPTVWSSAKDEAFHRDEVSHFLLRLYYCKDHLSTRWLVEVETELLRHRLMDDGVRHKIMDFVRAHNLNDYEEIQMTDLEYYRLVASQPGNERDFNLLCYRTLKFLRSQFENPEEDEETESRTPKFNKPGIMFKVRFEDALELISSRRVIPYKGFILIPAVQIIPVICQRFKIEMYRCMKGLRSILPSLREDERLIPMLEKSHNAIIGSMNSVRKFLPEGGLNMSSTELVEVLHGPSFPPCMIHIHRTLQKNHHLRHYARLQYCLFLKSIGFRFEETIQLLGQSFIHRMTETKFNSKYGYFFRYIYGREGKRRSFDCYSCARIMDAMKTGPLDCHGCPFKDFGSDMMNDFLTSLNVDESTIAIIIEKSRNRQFREACTTYFHFKNPDSDLDGIIYHPTQFFQFSRKAVMGRPVQ